MTSMPHSGSTRRNRRPNMAQFRSFGNRSTEGCLRSALMHAGMKGWRLHARDLPGRPDFVFCSARLAVFVDGCFWHGCPHCYRPPRSPGSYWHAKRKANSARDKKVVAALRRQRWAVMRVWEHEMREPKGVVARISRRLRARKHTR